MVFTGTLFESEEILLNLCLFKPSLEFWGLGKLMVVLLSLEQVLMLSFGFYRNREASGWADEHPTSVIQNWTDVPGFWVIAWPLIIFASQHKICVY